MCIRDSGQTLAKIFTNQITNWDDPQITKDNNGVQLPSIPIVPVVQSEGSGATQQLTDYFATEFPSIWRPFSGQAGPTEYFPRQGDQIAQNGSTGAKMCIRDSLALRRRRQASGLVAAGSPVPPSTSSSTTKGDTQ